MLSKFVSAYQRHIKAQWIFIIVLATTAWCTYLILDNGLEVTSFKVSAVIIGIFISKAVVAASVKAYPTMLTMFASSLYLATMLERFTDAQIFKDAAFEGLLLMLAGGIGLLIGELFSRFQSDRKQAD